LGLGSLSLVEHTVHIRNLLLVLGLGLRRGGGTLF
jgi:hypothetical protein